MAHASSGSRSESESLDSARRKVRLVLLLNAAELAGISPLPVRHLHVLAYLSDVLAPVWDLPALEGKILKLHGGPHYPALQRDIDRLIGMGVVNIEDISYIEDGGMCRIDGSFSLNKRLAVPILKAVLRYAEYQALSEYIREVALALSALDINDIGFAELQDATYSDPMVDDGEVVDFGEWEGAKNYSAKAARALQSYMKEVPLGRGEALHMYIGRIQARLHSRSSL